MSGTSNVIAAAIDNKMPDLKAINAIISELTGVFYMHGFHNYKSKRLHAEAKSHDFVRIGFFYLLIGPDYRFHDYEGYPLLDVVFAVRIFKSLGCEAVIVTNAAGAVNPNLKVGQIIALDDHLALPLKSVFGSLPEIGLEKGDVIEGIYAWEIITL
ncbi:uncharacterized protein MELLADRAFT_62551 [Melampsora larici-populina 98AG31]|uniref:purine-nucleoside phosphorylase n=1 Tax=Melampsora larici-populina (strain 98AG31 / pathotype 3-4-7) TaxID=747676 RepID=F4RJB9_MELLP|nr:uncharacterized protein MELLADRAFT_62551 [Melampsora larici-populina 98AG31]EGG07524.1 hypothetical protein MELLADRAFT_62551 [Melampsora larici-populina 98AG31]